MPLEPSLHFRMLVRRVVVHDQMQVDFRRCFPFNFLQSFQPLLVPMLRHTLGDDLSFGQFERGEQRRCAIAFVVVRHRAEPPGESRQIFLRAVECLNMALFVDRKHQCMFGWIEIQPDNIGQFLGKLRIVGDVERLRSMCKHRSENGVLVRNNYRSRRVLASSERRSCLVLRRLGSSA